MTWQQATVLLGLVAVFLFLVSGIRYTPGVRGSYSPPVCDPITDSAGTILGYGPCPSFTHYPTEDQFGWAPFWENHDRK